MDRYPPDRGRMTLLLVRLLILDADSEAAAWRAAEIGESPGQLRGRDAPGRAEADRTVQGGGLALEAYRYATLPTWRIIALDDTMFVSTFDEDWEGHASPIYRFDIGAGGALFRGFRRNVRRDDRYSRAVPVM